MPEPVLLPSWKSEELPLAKVRLPVTALVPIELPGAQCAPESTVRVPPVMLTVPIPPRVWPLRIWNPLPDFAVRSRTVPVEPAEPTTITALLLNDPALPRASVPALTVVLPE